MTARRGIGGIAVADTDHPNVAGPGPGDDMQALRRAKLLALYAAKFDGEKVAAATRAELCPQFARDFQTRAAQSLHARR